MKDIGQSIQENIKTLIKEEFKSIHESSTSQKEIIKTYSEDEAAAYLKRSKTTMWRIRKRGLISFNQYGRKIIYTQNDLDQFIEANKVKRI
jgi:ribosomal protein S20